MPILVKCRCGQSFHAPENLAGQTLPCPACGQGLPIPAGTDALNSARSLPPSRSDWTSAGHSTDRGVNWVLIAALAGGAAALVLVVVVAGIAAWSLSAGQRQATTSAPASSSNEAQASAPAAGVPLSLPAGPRIQVGPIGAEPEPPQPRALPATQPPNLSPGQTISLADGRFTLWVPSEQPLVEKVEGSGEDLFRYYDLTAANGAILRVMATFGRHGEHTRDGIQTARELSGKPRSILEEPWVVIEYQGLVGTATEKRQQRYMKASRRREFHHEGVGFVFWANGTNEQVNSPEIDWFFASLKFGKPDK